MRYAMTLAALLLFCLPLSAGEVTITIDGTTYRLEGELTAVPIEDNGEDPPPNGDNGDNGEEPPPYDSLHEFEGVEITDEYVSTHHDTIPRFVPPDALTNVQSGNWSDPETWGGEVPGHDALVRIAADTIVTYDVTEPERLDAIEVQGTLKPSDGSIMLFNELTIMPGGFLDAGTPEEPLAAEFIVRADTPLKVGTLEEPGQDIEQYGKAILNFGRRIMHGEDRRPTFAQFATEPLAEDTVLEFVEDVSNWQVGDRIVVPDTRQLPFQGTPRSSLRRFTSQAEERIIEAVDGSTVTITEPLEFDHRGPRDAAGNVGDTEREMLPHAMNLTRSLVIRSENPDDGSDQRHSDSTTSVRGHTMDLHRATKIVHHVALVGLGRTSAGISPVINSTQYDEEGNLAAFSTNRLGRYTHHPHHLMGPPNPDNTGWQGELVGCVIEDFMRWGVAVHGSHYLLVQDNVAYHGRGSVVNVYAGAAGAAFATEDGCESFNLFERNMVIHSKAGSQQHLLGSPAIARGGSHPSRYTAVARDGFWFQGQHNFVRANVVANAPDIGFNYNGMHHSGVYRVPKFRGADLHNPDEYTVYNMHGRRNEEGEIEGIREGLPSLDRINNIVYGTVGQGLFTSNAQGDFGSVTSFRYYSPTISVYDGYRMWHVSGAGVYKWGSNREHFNDFIMRNDPTVSAENTRLATGMTFGDTYYTTGEVELHGNDIQGWNVGIQLPHRPHNGEEMTPTVLQGGVLRNHINVEDRYNRFIGEKVSYVRDVDMFPVNAPSPDIPGPANIWMHPDQSDPHVLEIGLTQLFWTHEDRTYQLFMLDQAPNFVIYPYRTSRGSVNPNADGVGMTNAEAWEEYGISLGGEVAPCEDDCSAATELAEELGVIGLAFEVE